MLSFFAHHHLLKERLRGKSLALFLDYDGTLVPLCSHPDKTVLSQAVKARLRNFKNRHVPVAIVSGRPLADIRCQVGVPDFIYAGNHGFEISGRNFDFVHPAARLARRIFKKAVPELKKGLAQFPCVWIEDKKYTLSVHYRAMGEWRIGALEKCLRRWLAHYPDGRYLHRQAGKKVWEIRPKACWHKGCAVQKILSVFSRQSPRELFPVYIGADTTDEDAFRAVRERGLGIKVTSNVWGLSAARYYVKNTDQVLAALGWIEEIVKEVW